MSFQINTQTMDLVKNIGKSRLCREGIAFTCVLENDFNSVSLAKTEYDYRHGLSPFSLFTAGCLRTFWPPLNAIVALRRREGVWKIQLTEFLDKAQTSTKVDSCELVRATRYPSTRRTHPQVCTS
ncbi:ATP synthase subunit [Trichinella spiralis]|uniref:ATP synthase subunit n=1 Tax=Trichinella spiralis TaxID=6334 RepID=A0ABR3K5A7_TRISP